MSEARLKISSLVIQRLRVVEELSVGELLGVNDGELSILGFTVKTPKGPCGEDGDENPQLMCNHDIVPHLPANFNVLGAFIVCSQGETNDWETKFSQTASKFSPVLLTIDLTTHEVIAKLHKNGKYETIEYEVPKESYWKKFVHFHLTARVVISCNFDHDSLQDALSVFHRKINQGVAFQLQGTEVFILRNSTGGSGVTDKTTVKDLIDIVDSSKQKNKSSKDSNTLNFSMFLKRCCDKSTSEMAPVIKYEKKNFKCTKINLSLDTLSIVDVKRKANSLYEILLESVCRSLKLNEECLLKQFKSSVSESSVSLPEISHFLPKSCGHFISIAYPRKEMDSQLVSRREIFHKIFSLPMDMPMFRRDNAFRFVSSVENPSNILLNPHEGLNPSGVVNGEVSLVQGTYAYHHYMQDGVDDSGWGCAYRSLQTIISWFRYQGYTSSPIPTHKEIQECLVRVGVSPKSLIGSKQWIGSTEVSFALDALLGVSCRIISVNSGEELSMKGGELSHHFSKNGTPIMIGGGVLAHTILGVDYNKKTGALKFLILDPHYTGAEDLSVIQSKGWCGWKGMDFWKKDAFYNMCLPLRPKGI